MANPEKTQELELIRETLNGNSDAFRPLVEKYWGLVYSVIHKYVRDPETISDLCQEAFLIAFSKLNLYRHDYRFSPWLARIAINKAIEHLRREKRAPMVDFDPEMTKCLKFDPERLSEQRAFFDECIDKLSEEMQIIFILRHGLEFSYEEISMVLDIQPGTVKTTLFRIRNHLKRAFSAVTCNSDNTGETGRTCEGSESHEKQVS